MARVLLRPPAAEPVTLAAAKAHLRITHAEEDEMIAGLIAAARRAVEARTGLCLLAQGWMLFRDAWPEDGVIPLPLAPLRAVEELAVFGEEGEKATIDPAHYWLDAASRPARLALRGDRIWQTPGRTVNGIAVTVDAGFGTTPESVPEPLRQAMLMLVADWYENRSAADAPRHGPGLAALLAPYREMRL